jgi:hypothetical protein
MLTITEEMREAARQLLKSTTKLDGSERDLLTKVSNGKRKLIDGGWWRERHHDIVNQPKRAKLAALADPAHNDNVHERAVAATMLAKFKDRRPPGLHPEPPPLPRTLAEWDARRRKPFNTAKSKAGPVNTTGPSAAKLGPVNTAQAGPSTTKPVSTTKQAGPGKAKPVNTTGAAPSAKPVSTTSVNTAKPRSSDRHREPNRDRHSPGYMRDYMRRKRAARKLA